MYVPQLLIEDASGGARTCTRLVRHVCQQHQVFYSILEHGFSLPRVADLAAAVCHRSYLFRKCLERANSKLKRTESILLLVLEYVCKPC